MNGMYKEVKNYKDFISGTSVKNRIRNNIRNGLVNFLSLKKNISTNKSGIFFPYYHHVFDDEKNDFKRQLKYLKKFGDFITIDDAHKILSEKRDIKDRYFCLSFDDGFQNCFTNMLPITTELNIPVIIYLATNFINLDYNNPENIKKVTDFDQTVKKYVPFLSWKECHEMLKHNVSFGSHTCGHKNLMSLTANEIEYEMVQSKRTIEENLNTSCLHFAAPWGRINVDFEPKITKQAALKHHYITIATTNRGHNHIIDNPLLLKRDHLLAKWSNRQLDYFFGQ